MHSTGFVHFIYEKRLDHTVECEGYIETFVIQLKDHSQYSNLSPRYAT